MPLKLVQRPGSKVWYVRGTVRKRYCFETTGTAERAQAELYRATREAQLYEGSIFGERAVVSYDRAALSYLEDGKESRSALTKLFVARLVAHFKGKMLSEIAGDNAQSLLDRAVKAIVGDSAAPATKNRGVITPHNAILRHASRRGWCQRPDFERPSQPDTGTVWLWPRQALDLVIAASPHLKPLLIFLFCTGARLSEALDLQWPDIDLLGAKAILRDTKNGSDRVARLTPAAIVEIANLPGSNERTGHVFRRDDGEPYVDRERQEGGQIKTAWATACRRAGLIVWEREEGRGAQETITAVDGALVTPVRWRPSVTPHDARHTWASWFYALTKDPLLLKDEGGWKKAQMVERYAHLMPPEAVVDIALVWGASHPRIGVLPGAKSAQLPSIAEKTA